LEGRKIAPSPPEREERVGERSETGVTVAPRPVRLTQGEREAQEKRSLLRRGL